MDTAIKYTIATDYCSTTYKCTVNAGAAEAIMHQSSKLIILFIIIELTHPLFINFKVAKQHEA